MAGRRLRANVSALLEAGDIDSLKALALGGQGILRTLVALLYTEDDALRWRAVTALGEVAAAVDEQAPGDRIHDLIRRLFWMLNDESGGIGWHIPEALGELLFRVPRFAAAFGAPLASHLDLDPYGPGVLWAMGRLAQRDPAPVAFAMPRVRELLGHSDPLVRGRAAWCLGQARDAAAAPALGGLTADQGEASVFEEGRLRLATVGELAAEALEAIEQGRAGCP